MKIVTGYIKKIALILHLAAFKENVIDTWNRSSKNPDIFIKKMFPILQRYEKGHIDTKDIEQLKKDIFKGTDGQVELLWKMNRFEIVPVREKTIFGRCQYQKKIL